MIQYFLTGSSNFTSLIMYYLKAEQKNQLVQILPLESLIKDFSLAFSELKKSTYKLNEAMECSSTSIEKSKSEVDYDAERSTYFELDLQLKKYLELKNLLSTSPVTSANAIEGSKCVPLKINKPDALKFSGDARDFASFKRDFLTIVVPHRDDAQIGIHFKQAIPQKHKHLIANQDLTNWKGMMLIIEEELANPKMIIDQTIGEIDSMKTAESDNNFIKFVESLERIVRDLVTLENLSELANTSVLSKLEDKLPARIRFEWSKKVINENLSEMTSYDKFLCFMQYLKDAKKMTKYSLSVLRSSGKHHSFGTGTFINQPNNNKRQGTILPCIAHYHIGS